MFIDGQCSPLAVELREKVVSAALLDSGYRVCADRVAVQAIAMAKGLLVEAALRGGLTEAAVKTSFTGLARHLVSQRCEVCVATGAPGGV